MLPVTRPATTALRATNRLPSARRRRSSARRRCGRCPARVRSMHQRARGLDIADQARAAREQRRRAGHAIVHASLRVWAVHRISRAIDCHCDECARFTQARRTVSRLLQSRAVVRWRGAMRKTMIGVMVSVLGALALSGCSHEARTGSPRAAPTAAKAYQQFLKQHPHSANAAQAQGRIQQLLEERDWQSAAAADTRDRLRAVRDAASREQVGAGGAHPHRELCAGRRHATERGGRCRR